MTGPEAYHHYRGGVMQQKTSPFDEVFKKNGCLTSFSCSSGLPEPKDKETETNLDTEEFNIKVVFKSG